MSEEFPYRTGNVKFVNTVQKIKHNRASCKACGDVIESTHVHDFRSCKCGKIFVDGGREYIRVGGDLNLIEDLCEYESN